MRERFCLAFTAPCYNGPLFEAVLMILEVTYIFPPGNNPATQLFLEEATITYFKLSVEEIATYVTADDFQYYW